MTQQGTSLKPIAVFAFGASLTAGYGYDGFHPYTDWIEEATQGRFEARENNGVPGETTSQIKQRCIAAVKTRAAGATSAEQKFVVVFQGGTNDVGLGIPEEETIANLTEVATTCVSSGYPNRALYHSTVMRR